MVRKAIILAAGYGTRLGINKSKPLIEVGDKPLILYILEKLEDKIKDIWIVTNNRYFEDYENFLSSTKYTNIHLINDGTNCNEERLGALKDLDLALKHAFPVKFEEILVALGDNLFEDDLAGFLQIYNNQHIPTIAVYDVKDTELAKKYGIVEVDTTGKILNFEEKPPKPKSTLASTGLYLYPPETLMLLNVYLSDKKNPVDGPGNFVAWLVSQGHPVYTYRLKGRWWDIGSPESLNNAREYYKSS